MFQWMQGIASDCSDVTQASCGVVNDKQRCRVLLLIAQETQASFCGDSSSGMACSDGVSDGLSSCISSAYDLSQ